jgi:hypothetical protein
MHLGGLGGGGGWSRLEQGELDSVAIDICDGSQVVQVRRRHLGGGGHDAECAAPAAAMAPEFPPDWLI